MRILFYDTKPYDRESFEKIIPHYTGISIDFLKTDISQHTVNLSKGYDAVCVFVASQVNADIVGRLSENGVRLILLRCAGYNNVDIKYADGKIHIFHVPAYSPYAVAEHAIAMLLTSIRRIHKAYIRTKDFNFSLNGLTGFDLHGKTMGVIGTGKIGKIFIDICRGFGMRVIAYDKYPNTETDTEYVTLDKIYEQSDIISLHCPLNRETYHIIDAPAIEKCKKGVIILNTSRGALIDTEALLEGIKSRKIGAACLDVYEEESDVFFEDFSGHIIDDDNLARLISMPNVLVTSHQAFLTEEALNNIAETTVKNITDFSNSGKSDNELCQKS